VAEPITSLTLAGAERDIVARTWRAAWRALPALAVASAATCGAATVPVLVSPGPNPLALLIGAVCIGPFATALVVLANELVVDGDPSVARWWRGLRTYARFGIATALVPAAAATTFLAAAHVIVTTHSPLVWPSFAVTGAATVIATLGAVAVLPLGTATGPRPTGALWLAGIGLVTRHPTRFVAAVSFVVTALWAATAVSASLLLFLPAPAAIVAALATWTSTTRS
jgi:hypothetical protein